MSSYNFKINFYHAIESADINIDGITVLSGVNGSGKSTISRWLYYIVDGISRFPSLAYGEMKEKMMQELRNARFVYNDIYKSNYSSAHGNLDTAVKGLYFSKYNDDHDGISLYSHYKECVIIIKDVIDRYMHESIPATQRIRIWNSLGGPLGGTDSDRLAAWTAMEINKGESAQKEYIIQIEQKPKADLFSYIHSFYKETDEEPTSISLSEDGVDLLEGEYFNNLYGLDHAIYVDTPFAATESSNDNFFWNSLREMMTYPSSVSNIVTDNSKKITTIISKLINGTVTEDNTIGNHELKYVSIDGKESIKLDKVATGFKTFAYILRLLDNGWLNDKTLLLIDEPEAHLHPQWIVDFAHILILLNKFLGVKIVIASHNPDMVEAIQAAAEHERLVVQPRYYLSERVDKGLYSFRNLGDDIAPIFESFNKALDKMEEMGEQNYD